MARTRYCQESASIVRLLKVCSRLHVFTKVLARQSRKPESASLSGLPLTMAEDECRLLRRAAMELASIVRASDLASLVPVKARDSRGFEPDNAEQKGRLTSC